MKIGDTVKATTRIWRQDRRCELQKGEIAKVIRVDETDGAKIVAIELPDGSCMIDLVCMGENPPLVAL